MKDIELRPDHLTGIIMAWLIMVIMMAAVYLIGSKNEQPHALGHGAVTSFSDRSGPIVLQEQSRQP